MLTTHGRIQGTISRQLFTALADLAAISAETGTTLTLTTDNEPIRLRRIVQRVPTADGVNAPRARTSQWGQDVQQARIQRGDALLFALPDDPITPGTHLTLGTQRFEAVAVTSVELVENQTLYREVALRRIDPHARARAAGRVRQAAGVDLASGLEVGA